MNLNIVIIGDEILLGQVVDTNTREIALQTALTGWTVKRVITVGDSEKEIAAAVANALSDSDVVLTTGGLGPTKDDITKQVFCNLTGGKLVENSDALANLQNIMAARGLELNELTRRQALVPDTCKPIANHCGTAPGMWFDIPEGKVLVAMPGVPFETADMLASSVVPMLNSRFAANDFYAHRTLLLTGISESAVAERIDAWETQLPDGVHLAYLPNNGYLRLRLDVVAQSPSVAESTAIRYHDQLRTLLADHLFAVDDFTPARLLLELLKKMGLKVATAESCTGGNIAHQLTLIPGSSEVVNGGVVAYSNDVKTGVLGVSAETIRNYGAVSEQTVREMAMGAQRALEADVALATSGIAGPGGAVEGKPVGTVCIGIGLPEGGVVTTTCHFPGNRQRVIDRATNMALILAVGLLRNDKL